MEEVGILIIGKSVSYDLNISLSGITGMISNILFLLYINIFVKA